jgi:hypothetical protein
MLQDREKGAWGFKFFAPLSPQANNKDKKQRNAHAQIPHLPFMAHLP